MSTRSGRIRTSAVELSPPRTRKRVSPYRSPARTRKSSPSSKKTPPPARSSGRKSPARKSPSRKPASKFPARKSPSRATKEIEPTVTKLPPKRSINTEVAIMLEDLSSKLEIYRGTRSRRFEYSVKDVSSTITDTEFSADKINGLENDYGMRNRKPIEKVVSHQSSRQREFEDIPDIRSSVSKSLSHSSSMSKSISKSIDTYSDEENSEEELHKEKSRSVTRKLATPLRCSINGLTQISNRLEFGGQIGSTIFIILIPLIVFCILVSCKKSCSLKFYSHIVDHKSLKTWFSLPALGLFSSQLFIQAVFALLPVFGTRYDRMDDTGIKYCFNAFFSSIFTVSVLFVLDFLQIFNKNYLLNEHLRLAVVSYMFAFILSIVLYVKSRNIGDKKLNQYGDTGYTLYDLFMGREIHPFIKNLDVKIWISRISNISTLILLSLIFMQGLEINIDENKTLSLDNYKEFLNKVQLKPTILLFTMMQIVYVLNFIVREHKITTTFFWQSEGVGYLQTVSTALYPYYFTTISKHVADTKLVLSTNILISASVLYLLGFFIMLYSNNVKYEFRRNPLHLSLAHLDSIPTFHGKRLLVSGPWGILRHPNYTGDILIHIALALPGIVSRQYVAAMPALLTIAVLIHRAWRDHGRCKRKYGAAWQRYCKRVPSVFIPKVL